MPTLTERIERLELKAEKRLQEIETAENCISENSHVIRYAPPLLAQKIRRLARIYSNQDEDLDNGVSPLLERIELIENAAQERIGDIHLLSLQRFLDGNYEIQGKLKISMADKIDEYRET